MVKKRGLWAEIGKEKRGAPLCLCLLHAGRLCMLASASTDRYETEEQLRQSELPSFLPFLSNVLMF